jgi:hypothetical protein
VKIKTLEQKVGGMERSSGVREELKHVPTAVLLFGCEGVGKGGKEMKIRYVFILLIIIVLALFKKMAD